MTSKEFVIWLKGFTEACNDFTATPKQWDNIKEELNKVNDNYNNSISIGVGGTCISNTTNLPNHTNITYTNKQQLND